MPAEPPNSKPHRAAGPAPVVLDSNVIYSGLRSGAGLSAVLLGAAAEGRLRLALTAPLFLEYRDVVGRPEANGLSPDELRTTLDGLWAAASRHRVYYRFPGLPDPKDEKVLEAAVASRAGFLVTYNTRDFSGVAVPGLLVLTPAEFLRDHRPDLLSVTLPADPPARRRRPSADS